jgi:hypothetical protein
MTSMHEGYELGSISTNDNSKQLQKSRIKYGSSCYKNVRACSVCIVQARVCRLPTKSELLDNYEAGTQASGRLRI